MPNLRVETRNFPLSTGIADGATDLSVSWPQYLWAALSVGKGSLADLTQHGRFSMFEIIYRAAMVYANLMERNDRFVRSAAYDGLDPSEKSATSYFFGLAATKVALSSLFRVDWLMHVDVYRHMHGVELAPTGGRPDLFGLDHSQQWVVAEAKGRTHGHDDVALQKAKAQASQVIEIAGSSPRLSIGAVASFAGGSLQIVMDDPPPVDDGRGIRLKVERDQFEAHYYRPFEQLMEAFHSETEQVFGRRIQTVKVESADLKIGLSDDRRVNTGTDFAYISQEDSQSYLGGDGIFVKLGPSWSESLMQEEPQVRNPRSNRARR